MGFGEGEADEGVSVFSCCVVGKSTVVLGKGLKIFGLDLNLWVSTNAREGTFGNITQPE